MAKQKVYSVIQNGEVPSVVLSLVNQLQGQPVNKDTFFILDEEITFLVVDYRVAHGNTTPSNKTAWLCSITNGGNDWSVNFDAV